MKLSKPVWEKRLILTSYSVHHEQKPITNGL
jgi:hypothetical protein